MFGQQFAVSRNWLHRLVRCEVDFDDHCIRCFALRSRAPAAQPLLVTIPNDRHDKHFKGRISTFAGRFFDVNVTESQRS